MLERLGARYRSIFGHAIVGGAMLWAALPPLDLWPLAWVAPIWWVLLVRRPRPLVGRTSECRTGWARRRPYVQLWLAGFLFWLAALHWLAIPNVFTAVGWLALSFYLAFYLPVFIALGRVAVHRLRIPVILAAPVVWTGLELARGHLLTGFTMASLGHTQYRWIALVQLSDLAGAYGVGFVVMFVAACLARTLPSSGKSWTYWPLAPLVLILGGTLLYGHLRVSGGQDRPEQGLTGGDSGGSLRSTSATGVSGAYCSADAQGAPIARIALIQGSIDTILNPPRDTRVQMRRQYEELSEKAVAEYGELDLIVWPESASGDFLLDADPRPRVPDWWGGSAEEFKRRLQQGTAASRERFRDLARRLRTPLLVGATTHFFGADGERRYNSGVFVPLGGRPLGRYDKMHRVVFGEYVPFAKQLSWLVRLTPLNSLGLIVEPGNQPAAFDVAGLRLAPNICYESVMPHVIRRQVNTLAQQGREPDVLVNLTNDGWFFGSAELDMHLVCGVFRAVECRKPFLIAANTGFSAWIDADGRILARGPRRATATILAQVGAGGRTSWYRTHGDWPAGLCLAACLAFALVGFGDHLAGRISKRGGRGSTKRAAPAAPADD